MTGGDSTVDGDTELRLVQRLQAGDATALEGLMEGYSSRLYRLAFGITRNPRDAEEVLQDVFLTVFRKIGSFERRAKLGTWLYRITTNLALNKRRGLAATVEVAVDDLLPTYLTDGHRASDRSVLLTDWSETPEDELLAGEGRAALERALSLLPDDYRAVLVLRDVDDLSNEEAAGVLGESVSSVKSRLHRARMALREVITRSLAPKYAPATSLGEVSRPA
jgi:RNA polymerase sigma-70 factor, ECF subfamily